MKDRDPDPEPEVAAEDSDHHPALEALSFLEPRDRGSGDIDEGALLAYRRGELDEAAAEALERKLANSDRVRRRLIGAAGVQGSNPSPFLRARVLQAYGEARRKGRRRALAPAAWALAAVLLFGVIGVLLRPAPGLPPELTYAVSARGLAEVRSGEVDSVVLEAYADTPVEFSAAPEARADADVAFAIYRLDDETWTRVADPGDARVRRGAATFSLTAGQLVGENPGRYELLLSVARPGGLPASLSADEVENDGERRHYRRTLIVLE
ncbi:MAG: hypothetical protein AAGM22_31970 [Acidobacteriota bacterium]